MSRPDYLTGAQLVFEGGSLHLDFRQKRGHFAFTDDELEPISETDEDGTWEGQIAKLPDSELEAIRDFLNKWLIPPWQPIETAPKGGGAELVTDPAWIDPPEVLLLFGGNVRRVGKWDWYYAEGGDGDSCADGVAWVDPVSGDLLATHYGAPTDWMPLPEAPK